MMIDFTLRSQELIMAESTNIVVGFSGQKKNENNRCASCVFADGQQPD